MLMLSNTIVKALYGTDIMNYRMKLCVAIFANSVDLPTTYDVGYVRGLEHALYLLDDMCTEEIKIAISNANIERAISNANIAKYRKILLDAINAHEAMTGQTEYDKAFHQGMQHALTILDNFCNDAFKAACVEALNKKFGGAKE